MFTIFVAATLAVMLVPGVSSGVTLRAGFTTSPDGGVSGAAFPTQPVVSITDGSDVVDTSGSYVTLSIASGGGFGTLRCSGTGYMGRTVSVSHGVATFSGCKITLNQGVASHDFTLRATSSDPLILSGTSALFTVALSTATPTQLDFVNWPTAGVHNTIWAPGDRPVIALLDGDGLVVDDSTTPVTLSLASPGDTKGTLSCGGTGTGGRTFMADHGYVTASNCKIVLNALVSSYDFILRADATGLTYALSGSFPVTRHGSYLAYATQPGGGVAGTAWSQQPVVALVDPYGYLMADDSSTYVTLSVGTNPTGGTLSCTSGTTVRASHGYAYFTGCRIDVGTTLSTFRLYAQSDPYLNPATSDAFFVTPSATSLAFTTQPGGGIVDTVWAQQPVVAIRNAAGVVAGDSATLVTLAIGANPGGGALFCSSGTTVRAVAGYATFTGCRIYGGVSTSPYTLVATSSPPLTGATSSGFYVSNARVTLTLGLKDGFGRYPLAYNTTNKLVPRGYWITFRVATSPRLAGKYVGIYISTRQDGWFWPAFSRYNTILIGSNGVGYLRYHTYGAVTRRFLIRYPGDALVTSASSNVLQVRWR